MNRELTREEIGQQRRRNIGRLLRPNHIAFIGGSQAAGALAACRRAGFAGELWVVNPRRQEVEGIACVARIEDLPEPPDAALVALSPERTIEAVRSLQAVGAGGAVCMAAGFAELGGDGATLQQKLIDVAGDLAVLGPNCMGVLNQFDGAAIWGSDNHMEQVGAYGAALISQSGALVFGITNVEQAFPLGYGISTGNQAVVDTADCVEAVLDDPRVRAIGIYLEGLVDGQALGAACWRALQMGIPVIALKGGDTPAGETVALSHTGAMVVERDLWEAFAQRYGIVEVSSPKAMVETLKLLAVGGVPKGSRLSVVTYSGGLNGLVAARAPRLGLELRQPTADNAAKLRAKMPPIVPIANPLDLNLPWRSKTGMSMENGQSIAEGIVDLADGVADMVAFILDVPRPDENRLDADWLPSVEGMAYVRETLGVPTAVSGIMPEGLDVNLRKRLLAKGIAPLLGFSDAMEAFAVAGRLADTHAAKAHRPYPALLPLLEEDGEESKPRMLDEAESKALLRPFGLKLPLSWAGRFADAPAAAAKIGFPVVLKVLSNEIAHKAKVGGVKVGLASVEAVETAVSDILNSGTVHNYEVVNVLVEQMVRQPMAEFMVGIKRHPGLGLALVIGLGGTAVEQLRHYKTLLLPLEENALNVALNDLGVGHGSLGNSELKAAVLSVANFAANNQHRLIALDVNPIIITATGEAIAVDALVVL